jgi:hypothetical protein
MPLQELEKGRSLIGIRRHGLQGYATESIDKVHGRGCLFGCDVVHNVFCHSLVAVLHLARLLRYSKFSPSGLRLAS